MPLVSVVLPAYNAAGTMERGLQSILNQSLRDIELIVVDDGSTDATARIVNSVDDSRLHFLRLNHQGVASAANAGTARATSPFIARMDADDFSYPARLEEQLDLLVKQEVDVVGTRVRIVDSDGHPVSSMENYERWINDETRTPAQIRALRFVEFPLVNPSILAKRAYFELGFRDQEVPEDYELFLRACEAGMTFAKVDEVLLDWTDSKTGLTRTDPRYSRAAFDRCRRRFLISGPLAGFEQVDLWGIGQAGKPWLRWLQQEGITVRRGYDIHPKKDGEFIHGVLISHPDKALEYDGTPILIAVGAAGARQAIAPQLERRGYTIGVSAWFVA